MNANQLTRGFRHRLGLLLGIDRSQRPTPRRRTTKLGLEMLEDRIVPTTYFQLNDLTGLAPSVGTAYVAGFINGNQVLQSNGTFGTSASSSAPFYAISSLPSVPGITTRPTVQLSATTNGNDRLVFVVAPTAPTDYPLNGYTAYPFPVAPGVSPPGPYDIFEFGLNAQDDLSAVDSFGLNLSFTGDPDYPTVTYGALPEYSRAAIQAAYTAFMRSDLEGTDFQALLYSSPGTTGYPPLIAGQFSAIVSPKDWLAIHPTDALASYWITPISDFFKAGNHLSIDVGPQPGSNGLDVIYSGSFDGTNYNFTRNLPLASISGFGLTEQIPASQFTSSFVFSQGLPPLTDSGQGALYDAILEAFERGVALDGVFTTAKLRGESTTAWNNTNNWYTNHLNAYNNKPSKYDAYAKFFHYSTINGTDFRTDPGSKPILGLNQAGLFAQAYGFSLDENPFPTPNPATGVGTTWPSANNVPAKTPSDVPDGTTLTITLGPWLATSPTVTGVSPAQGPPTGGTPVVISGSGFTGATTVNFNGAQLLTGSFTVNGAGTSITLNSPAAPGAGTVDIRVTTPQGTSVGSIADQFTYRSADHLAFQQQPQFTFVNRFFRPMIVVQIVDSQGSAVAQRGERITLSLLAPNGAVLSGYVANTDASGRALFPRLRVNLPGRYHLRATRTFGNPETPIDPATSNVFNVARIAPFTVAVQTPAILGHPLQFTVTYPDIHYRGTVQFFDARRVGIRWFPETTARINTAPISSFTYTFHSGDVVGQTVQHTFQLEVPFAGLHRLLVRDLLSHFSGVRVFLVTGA